MATINVKDAAGATVALEKPLVPGRAAAAASRPVALSNEDAAFLDGIETLLAAATPAGSNLIGKVGIDQTTPGTTNATSLAQIGATTVATGSGAMSAGVQRVALATDSPGVIALGTAKTPPGGSTVLSNQQVADMFGQYEIVAASATAQALGATGATGDYLAYVIVFPGTAGCGVVTILDNATTWGTFAGGGTTALPALVPFRIDVGAYSTSGAWKITTGANVTCVGVGAFT